MMKRNDGYTLVELIVTIAVGTLVTAAASTLLLLGFRINARSSQLAVQQNTTRLVMEVMGELAAEEAYGVTTGDAWSVTGQDGTETILSYHSNAIYVRNTALLNNVAASNAAVDPDSKLLTISITMEDGLSYTTSVYCRMLSDAPTEGEATIQTAFTERNYQEVLTFAVASEENTEAVTEFLMVLASQYGSRGQILNENGEGTGEYFSEWYIGGYGENPGWDADTPWCACYLSWAMAQCEGLAEAPRFANVDSFWAEFVTEQSWTASKPVPGDIVFFDWIVDEDYDPQHVGAVLAVSDGWIYTIEGNSGNRVAVCRYQLEDPCILGYGQLTWKSEK